jgi:hypothetical protein
VGREVYMKFTGSGSEKKSQYEDFIKERDELFRKKFPELF